MEPATDVINQSKGFLAKRTKGLHSERAEDIGLEKLTVFTGLDGLGSLGGCTGDFGCCWEVQSH